VRKIAQLVYQAPFPIAEMSVPAARRFNGSRAATTLQPTLNDAITIHRMLNYA
jgi:hypothetical protein